MKRFSSLLLTVFFLLCAVPVSGQPMGNSRLTWQGERWAGNYASLNALVAAHNAQTPTVLPEQATIDGTLVLTANLTGASAIPTTLALDLTRGNGQIDCQNTYSVNIGGAFRAPDRQVFINCPAGNIVFGGRGITSWINGRWWGTLGNGTGNQAAALQASLSACPTSVPCEVYWAPGNYITSGTTLTLPVPVSSLQSFTLWAEGAILNHSTGSGAALDVVGNPAVNVSQRPTIIHGLQVYQPNNTSATAGIRVAHAGNVEFIGTHVTAGNNAADYGCFLTQQSNVADPDTGGLWVRYNHTVCMRGAGAVNAGWIFEGHSNANTVRDSFLLGPATNGVIIRDQAGGDGAVPNDILIDHNDFETTTTNFFITSSLATANLLGLRFTNNRMESMNAATVLSITGITSQVGAYNNPPLLSANQLEFFSTWTYINNSNNLKVDGFDLAVNEWHSGVFASLNSLIAGAGSTVGTAIFEGTLAVTALTPVTIPATLTLSKRGAGLIDCQTPQVAISTIARTGNVVTVTTATPHGFPAGTSTATIADVPVSNFNGTWTITKTGDSTFTYAQTAADDSSSGGTATLQVVTIRGPVAVGAEQLFVNCPAGAVGFPWGYGGPEINAMWWGPTPSPSLTVNSQPQIQAAITAADEAGLKVRVPAGQYLLDGSGAQLLLIQNSATILEGDGWMATMFMVKSTVPATTDVIRVYVPTGAVNAGYKERGGRLSEFAIYPQSGTPGKRGIVIDGNAYWYGHYEITHVDSRLANGVGYGIELDAPFASADATGFAFYIHNNLVVDGIKVTTSDTNRITENIITGANDGVHMDMTSGAAENVIAGNNIIVTGACIYVGQGLQVRIHHNQCEHSSTDDFTPNGAMIDVGTGGYGVLDSTIEANNINASLHVPYAIRFGTTARVKTRNNSISNFNTNAYDITAGAVDTQIGDDIILSTGTTPTSVATNAGTRTIFGPYKTASTANWVPWDNMGASAEYSASGYLQNRVPLLLKPIAYPGAPAGAVAAGGSVDDGAHTYRVTFVTTQGESALGTTSAIVTTGTGNNTVNLSVIPTGAAGLGVTSRKIYRTKVGDANTWYLLTTLANNTDTTYPDTTADAALGAARTAGVDGTAPSLQLWHNWQGANNEYFEVKWDSPFVNGVSLRTVATGSGTARPLLVYHGNSISSAALWIGTQLNGGLIVGYGTAATANTSGRVRVAAGTETTATSGNSIGLLYDEGFHPTSASTMVSIAQQLGPVINYAAAGAGSYEISKIKVTETALPTGTNYLARWSAGSAGTTDIFSVLGNQVANTGIGTTTGTVAGMTLAHTFNPASGTPTNVGFLLAPTINWGGTPGAGSYSALRIAVTETALPTGKNYVLRALAGATATQDIFAVTNKTHVETGQATPPALAAGCGTGATIVGTDTNGRITTNATAFTTCAITFTTAFTNIPQCFIADETTTMTDIKPVPAATTLTFNGTGITGGDVLSYFCIGRV